MTATWTDDHEPLDSPEALFAHLADDHGLVEAQGLDPARAPVQFWIRRHADLHTNQHEPDHDEHDQDEPAAAPPREAPARTPSRRTRRRPDATTTPPAPSPAGAGAGRAMQPAAQTTAATTTAGTPTRTPRRPRGGRWGLARLLRSYLLAATLLLAAVLTFAPGLAEPPLGYRLDVTNATTAAGDGGLVEAAGVAALKAAGWVTRQAADRQGELLTDHPLATRLLTPASVGLHGWIQPYRLPVAIAGTMLLAGLIFLGVYGLPARHTHEEGGRWRLRRRWWLLGVTLTLLTTAVVCFPAPALSAANAPGVVVARQAVNLSANHLLPPDSLNAAQAQELQARLAEDYWTQFVTNPVSRQQTRSSILVHTPPEHRGEVTAFLHTRGVEPAAGLHGAVISTSGLGAAVLGALVIGGAAWLALTAQAALLLLLFAGVWLVPVWCARGQVQRLILWWLLPLALLLGLTTAGALASVAATRSAAWLAWAWELLSTTITGAAVATAVGVLVAWRVRRRTRRRRVRRQHHAATAASEHADTQTVAAGNAGAAA